MSKLKLLIEDIICIILLLLIPDFILEKTGLLRSIEFIFEERMAENDSDLRELSM